MVSGEINPITPLTMWIINAELLVLTLCEMCPNTEFFLVRIFPHSDWIRRDTKYLSVFSPNAGKYGPEKTPYLDTFHVVLQSPFLFLQMFYIAVFQYFLKLKCEGTIFGMTTSLHRILKQNLLKAAFQRCS